jgi:hypothetical protein
MTTASKLGVHCPRCKKESKVSSSAAGRKLRCGCGATFQVPSSGDEHGERERERDWTSYVAKGESVRLPDVCACCLEPATMLVGTRKTQSDGMVKTTKVIRVPYCHVCAQHASWAGLGGTTNIFALPLIGLVFGTAMSGIVFNGIVSGGLNHLSSNATRDIFIMVLCVLIGAAAGYGALRWTLSRRPKAEVSEEHSCAKGTSVTIVTFSETFTKLAFADARFGRAVAQSNGRGRLTRRASHPPSFARKSLESRSSAKSCGRPEADRVMWRLPGLSARRGGERL